MNAFVLVGSPKGRNSSSFLLGAKLAEGLERHGAATRLELLQPALRTAEGERWLLDRIGASDIVVFAFPLYVDSLPSPLTRLLELVAGERAGDGRQATRLLAVVVQCGFPEPRQCDTAVGICRLFARRTGMRWGGALAMGMGGSLERGIEKLPRGGRNVLRALDMASESLARGEGIPPEASDLFAAPFLPRWMYTLFGNLGWRILLRRNRARRPLAHRPHPQ